MSNSKQPPAKRRPTGLPGKPSAAFLLILSFFVLGYCFNLVLTGRTYTEAYVEWMKDQDTIAKIISKIMLYKANHPEISQSDFNAKTLDDLASIGVISKPGTYFIKDKGGHDYGYSESDPPDTILFDFNSGPIADPCHVVCLHDGTVHPSKKYFEPPD